SRTGLAECVRGHEFLMAKLIRRGLDELGLRREIGITRVIAEPIAYGSELAVRMRDLGDTTERIVSGRRVIRRGALIIGAALRRHVTAHIECGLRIDRLRARGSLANRLVCATETVEVGLPPNTKRCAAAARAPGGVDARGFCLYILCRRASDVP